jgi:hypothetical protein
MSTQRTPAWHVFAGVSAAEATTSPNQTFAVAFVAASPISGASIAKLPIIATCITILVESSSVLHLAKATRFWYATSQRFVSSYDLQENPMPKTTISEEALRKGEELERIGNRGVRKAQEENRRLGIPNVYSINGILYYELPNGELSREDPYSQAQNSASAQ